MARSFLLIIIVVPALEIGLFILSGKTIGFFTTLLIFALTGFFGVWFAKKEGLQALKLAELQAQRGELPSEALLDGICVLIGGLLLISPGYLTDAVGLLILIPKTRGIFKALLKKLFQTYISKGSFVIFKTK